MIADIHYLSTCIMLARSNARLSAFRATLPQASRRTKRKHTHTLLHKAAHLLPPAPSANMPWGERLMEEAKNVRIGVEVMGDAVGNANDAPMT